MHAARTHLLPASPLHRRTFYARSIPADASNTTADVEARAFTSQRAHIRLRAEHGQRCLGDSVVNLNIRAPRRRYKHKQELRRGQRRSRYRSRHCRDAADATPQTPSATTPAPPSSPVPPTSTGCAQPRGKSFYAKSIPASTPSPSGELNAQAHIFRRASTRYH
eukprot:4717043-Pleurochrysis_carterae.AAC.4